MIPLSSPEHLNGHEGNREVEGEPEMEDLESEQPPAAMNELACEALTEELKQMQVSENIYLFASEHNTF